LTLPAAMTHQQRLDLIEQYIRENKYADLRTLAERFRASLSTVRRTLDTLESRGVLRRHHGGASLVEHDELSREFDFAARDEQFAAEKYVIARHIADMIKPGMTVLLDGGSSTYAVARLLAGKRLQVITNSLPVAGLFSEIGSFETIVLGGTIYSRLGVLTGPQCEQALATMHADLGVLGAAGVTVEGVWGHNALITAVQAKMIEAAEQSVFAVDSSKFGCKALSLAARFDPRFTIVTDKRPAPPIARAIAAAGAALALAGA
jgi:DeoR/GlpR family transcriptional regulator of sugar metabolism